MTAARFESRWYQRVVAVTERAVHQRRPSPRRLWFAAGILSMLFLLWVGYRLWLQPEWIQMLPAAFREFLGLAETAAGVTLVVLWLALGWWSHQRHHSPILLKSVDELYAFSPAEFERYVANVFRRKGYTVKHRGRSGDHGVDLELMKENGKRAIVQCKRYRTTIGPDIVRELYGTMIHERVAHAFLVTTADISESSREWAQGKPMTLIDGETLVQAVRSLSRPAA